MSTTAQPAGETAGASSGGTEFPIWRKPCHFVEWRRNQSGNE
jgi:hypothetical protein